MLRPTNVICFIWPKCSLRTLSLLLILILNFEMIPGILARLQKYCDYDWNCGPNAVCGYNTCICQLGYTENAYGSSGCSRMTCSYDYQCIIFGSNTQCLGICSCKSGYLVKHDTQRCESENETSSTWSNIRIVVIVCAVVIGLPIFFCCARCCCKRKPARPATSTTVIVPRRARQQGQISSTNQTQLYSQPQYQQHPVRQPQQHLYPQVPISYQSARADDSTAWYSSPVQTNDAAPSAPPSYFESIADQAPPPSQNPGYTSHDQTRY